ncbi:MAG TPA: KEOPS complex subunit Pcc1 [Candidatus Thalassarchaeaceae archaeon]|nr:KEOPS complex subunit Pcc1 [Candidatus Thalassarchaeaceae archaeon]
MESHEAVLTWFGNSNQLEVLKSAIENDDSDSFEIVIKDDRMEIRVCSPSLRSLRSTVDDILACLAAAESALEQMK